MLMLRKLSLPDAVRLPLAVYRAAFPLALTLLAPSLLLRMLRRGNWSAKFAQRLGCFDVEDVARLGEGGWTWIHSISVGETLVALKLVRALQAACPQIRVALSVTTSTGYALAREASGDFLFAFYNPVDVPSAVERVLEGLKPDCLVLIEGEVWPNLVSACVEAGIPVMLANARLSPRSAARFARWKRWCAPFFGLLEWIAVPDAQDVSRWEKLGVSQKQLRLTGSVKFDHGDVSDPQVQRLRELVGSLGVGEATPVVVAGSTHEGEERMLVEAMRGWRSEFPELRLIIVPRHIERAPALMAELRALGVRLALRSELPVREEADVLIVDTTGELRSWYGLCTVAFVGKSLCGYGGQNPVEPALAGKPVVFGPHMENFAVVVAHLLAQDAAVQVSDAASLERHIAMLLRSPARRQQLGDRAKSALKEHQGSASRTAALILQTRARRVEALSAPVPQ